ncbi:MAG TPA: M20/M25/M40 family metallo-hydrolase [Vicinamibacterales bacterium]|nr:M20/M25/M40 family metallo-hydrolase [Vicinamibacterales bacterium]
MVLRQLSTFALVTATLFGTPAPARAQTPAQSKPQPSAREVSAPRWLDQYRQPAARLIGAAMADRFAWRRLATLTDTIGHRLSGTPELQRAIEWALAEMKRDGLENVHAEPVMVPRWVRGRESAEIVEPARHQLVMLGLGDSVGTPSGGIQAEALIVHSFQDLEAATSRVHGRIVVFNVPFTNYDQTRPYRSDGPSRAAQLGAVAVLVRSVGPAGLRLPHTGGLSYAPNVTKIPAAAITTEDADRLQRMADRGDRIVLRLQMEAHFEADAPSANVVGELRGREFPDEIVAIGGHIDSWDVGAGASDDGGGIVATWEALRLMKSLGLRPRRTVRVVLWTNEENGTGGGRAYRDTHLDELSKHVMMLEADSGLFRPVSFAVTANNVARDTVRAIATLLANIEADTVTPGGGGSDIGPSVTAASIPAISYEGTGDYFLLHHTPADTVDKIDPVDVSRAAAAIAVMTYVIADLPQRLGVGAE